MRGDTAGEKVAALLPRDFKADLWHRKGDTYVGYEKEKNRLVLVDWRHAKVLSPAQVLSLEPVHESLLGITHTGKSASTSSCRDIRTGGLSKRDRFVGRESCRRRSG